jgi:hypothetical protein
MEDALNLLGLIIALAFFLSAILVFISRLAGKPEIGHAIGYFEILMILPLVWLLLKAPGLDRPLLYYVQVGAIIAWLILELFLDYIFKVNFRHTRWIVILYVMLFFAGAGGLLGISYLASRFWGHIALVLFMIMAILTFVQRKKTGY